MHLTRLRTVGFRNLSGDALDVDAPLVAFVGGNGQGKTNLLEAVGVLGTLKSFRTSRVAEVIRHGDDRADVEGVGESEGFTRTWRWSFGEGARGLRRDDRVVDSLAWLRSLRATTFAPADTALVRGEPALRRALLDRAVMTIRPDYLGPARDLRRILEHKSALLRASGDDAALDVLDEQLVAVGARVSVARSAAVRRLRPLFQTIYADLSDGESADVSYECSLGDPHDAVFEAEFAARLARARRQERALRRPLAGPQRDDVAFLVRGAPARAFASQGQARSVVLAWKLAELAVAREDGEAPMFLLDDLGSELDPDRTARLVRHVRGFGAQVFLTTTDARFLPEGAAARVYTVVGGAVRAVEA